MSEAEVQAQAVALLQAAGAELVYHTHDSRKSEPGWPDLAAVIGHTLWCIECKTSSGLLRPEQAAWLNALAAVPGVRVWLATPDTLGALARELGVTVHADTSRPAEGHTASQGVPLRRTRRFAADDAQVHQIMHELGLPRERAEEIAAHNAGR